MNNLLSKLVSPAGLLYIYLIIMQVAHGIYAAAELEPPPAFILVDYVGLIWLIGWWLLRDSRKRGVAWVYDMGLFLSIAWPFIMPYYLIKTRGSNGGLVIFGFVGAYMLSAMVGVAVYVLLVTLNQ